MRSLTRRGPVPEAVPRVPDHVRDTGLGREKVFYLGEAGEPRNWSTSKIFLREMLVQRHITAPIA